MSISTTVIINHNQQKENEKKTLRTLSINLSRINKSLHRCIRLNDNYFNAPARSSIPTLPHKNCEVCSNPIGASSAIESDGKGFDAIAVKMISIDFSGFVICFNL